MLKEILIRPSLWISVLALVLVATFFTVLIWNAKGTQVEIVSTILIPKSAESAKHGPLTTEAKNASAISELTKFIAAIDPRVSCEKPLQELSDECLKSLDKYFWERPFVWKEYDWLPLPLSYSRIFADPAADRANVFLALEKPECRLEKGEIRWDLRDSCRAESFANYANFLYFCQYVKDELRSEVELSQELLRGPGYEPTVYQWYARWDGKNNRPSKWLGERLLEGRWILESTCTQYSMRSLELDDEHYEILMAIWKRLGEKTGKYNRAFDVLVAIAARLGNEWASSVYESPRENDAWNVHETEEMSWKRALRDMRSKMNQPSTSTARDARKTALRLSIETWGKLEASGIDIDLDRMVDYVCGGNWLSADESCEDTIANLKEHHISTDQGFWHRLSTFEARSIQNGLYETVPSYRDRDSWEAREFRMADPIGYRTKWTDDGESP